jgi:hypothetical protein
MRSRAHPLSDARPAGGVTAGSVWLSQDGRETELGHREFSICDSGRPYSLVFGTTFLQMLSRFPRTLLRQRFGSIDHFTAVKVPGNGRLAS